MTEFTVIRGKPSRSEDWTFTLVQAEIELVRGFASYQTACEREALHYANIYSQDGPCTVTIRPPRGWRP